MQLALLLVKGPSGAAGEEAAVDQALHRLRRRSSSRPGMSPAPTQSDHLLTGQTLHAWLDQAASQKVDTNAPSNATAAASEQPGACAEAARAAGSSTSSLTPAGSSGPAAVLAFSLSHHSGSLVSPQGL